ncbi:MAG TPA: hypothetical protein VK900_10355 [Anaerolineales bacterium]|nr:hypothetical protein [Anaerolineales bacterium]
MDFNWTTIAWIVGLLFVYIFGLVEGRGQGYKKRKAEETQDKQNQPPPAPETVTVDEPGILRIREEQGAFLLDLDGVHLNPASFSAEQRKRLIEILNVMRPWLEGRPSAAPAPTGVATPSLIHRKPAEPPSGPPVSITPPSPPVVSQPPAPRSPVIAKEDRPVAPTNSIVSQIDSVLQARLTGTPLEDRGIFLAQSPEGMVNVYVGLTRYNGVDEVPDPEIKAAIRAAIAEWEDRFTPGL